MNVSSSTATGGDWWSNMMAGPEVTPAYVISNWCVFSVAAFILLHSCYVNGRRRHIIRTFAELCASGAMLTSICCLICTNILYTLYCTVYTTV